MKKSILFCFLLGLVMTGFCQKPKSDFVLDKKMYQIFSQTEIENMYDNDFAKLFRMNFKMVNFAMLSTKYEDGADVVGYLEEYANPGVKVDEAKIIREGCLNPYDFTFPQSANKVTVVQMHTPGYCINIHSKYEYESREQASLNQYQY